MPASETTQSAQPNLPGSEPPQSTPPSTATTNRRDNDLADALFGSQPKSQPEKRSEVPSTPDTSKSAQERKDNPTEPQQEADKDATQTPPAQQTDPNLTPEEQSRREEQSFKDRYYALERERDKEKAERETLLERQRVEQMSRQEQVAYQRFQEQVKPLETQAWQLHNAANDLDQKGQDALAEGDRELANYFFQQRDVMRQAESATSNNVRWQYNSFNQSVSTYRQQVHTERLTQQEKQLSRSLGKYGLTLDDLKAVNPKLDTTDNFAVIEAIAEAKDAKHKAEVKSAKEESDRVAKEERAKWRTDSPAARPDRPVTGGSNGRSGSANRGGPGSGTADIAEGLGLGRRK